MKRYDILIPGNYSCDMIFRDIDGYPELGKNLFSQYFDIVPGGISNTVFAMRRLGINVGWLTECGNDIFSRFILAQAELEHVDTSLILQRKESIRRVTVALSYPEDRAFVSYTEDEPDVVEMALNQGDDVEYSHLHFARLHVDARMPGLLRRCKARGVFISTDCQYHEHFIDDPLVREILSLTDMFIPNEKETQELTQTNSLEEGAKILADIVPCLVVKQGGEGAHAWHDGKHIFQEAMHLKPSDTTGAGDVFNAGLLAAHIAGHNLATCLRWAVVAGGLATQGPGGTTTAPNREQLEAQLRKLQEKAEHSTDDAE
jgi:sugar/nucleoside kinase (ribokinase family)